jgi:hypothetical protein
MDIKETIAMVYFNLQYQDISWELKENTSCNSRSLSQDLKPCPVEYEAGGVTTTTRHSFTAGKSCSITCESIMFCAAELSRATNFVEKMSTNNTLLRTLSERTVDWEMAERQEH